MMLTFRPIDVWPGELTRPSARRRSPFEAAYQSTLDLLARELSHLRAGHVVVQMAIGEGDIRNDGRPYAHTRPEHPGVIVALDSMHGPLKYQTDVFDNWQANLRAIALGLEALRKVERYGITKRGEQYTGWKALGGGVAMGPAPMTVDEAALFLIEHGEWATVNAEPDEIIGMPETISAYYREAAKKLHPDAGGDAELFKRLTEAKALLDGAA